MSENNLPECNFCKEWGLKAEWEFVYGESPTNHYAYCCTTHIPDLIKSIENGKHGPVFTGYLTRFGVRRGYNVHWNEAWKSFYKTSQYSFFNSKPTPNS